ncbi:hypothetical protein QTP86_029653, partial [Hemibagrus guttatus]
MHFSNLKVLDLHELGMYIHGFSFEAGMMSTKEEPELQESRISTVQHAGTHITLGARSASIALSSTGSWRDSTRSWGWLLSGAVLVNVLVLGCALVSGSVFNAHHLTSVHLQLYLVALIVTTTIWMIFYKAYTCRVDEAVLYKDMHAGPVWLRGGLVLFGICSLIMDVFKVAFYVGHVHCDSPVKIVFPAVQAMFILVQTYFLWLHAKDCVQVQRNITRSGLMLTLATNLMIWMMAVTDESLHKTVYPNDTRSLGSRSLSLRAGAPSDNNSCVCTIAACSIFEEGYYYLYPFNIEYSLFASAMAYVMWKNVGRLVDDHGHNEHRFHMRDVLIGPATGLLVLVAGLTIFIVYEVDVSSEEPGKKDTALIMYYVANTITVVLMTVAAVAGCALYRLEQREHAVGKNPTRSLDVGLLVGASVGQLTVSYFTIVAVLAIGVGGLVNALNLTWSVLTIVELCVQNIFIIEGLRREPHQDTRRASIFSNLLALQAHDECRRSSNVLTPRSSIAISIHKPLPWKRKLLKEVSSFLLLSNII